MKVRVLPGSLNNYLRNGGSWDEASPDPASFLVELVSLPTNGGCILFSYADLYEGAPTIGEVDNVVISSDNVYVFVDKMVPASPKS